MKLVCTMVLLIVLVAVQDVSSQRRRSGGRGGRGGGRRGHGGPKICLMTYRNYTETKTCSDDCRAGTCSQTPDNLPECIANAVGNNINFNVTSFTSCTEDVPDEDVPQKFPNCTNDADCPGVEQCVTVSRRGREKKVCTCGPDDQCNAGYTCTEESRRRGNGGKKYCLPDNSCRKVFADLKNNAKSARRG